VEIVPDKVPVFFNFGFKLGDFEFFCAVYPLLFTLFIFLLAMRLRLSFALTFELSHLSSCLVFNAFFQAVSILLFAFIFFYGL